MTLVEVVLAMWILLLVVVIALAILHRSLRLSSHEQEATRAAFLASQRMEQAFVTRPSKLAPAAGAFRAPFSDYRWRLTTRPLPGGDFLLLEVDVTDPAGQIYRLRTQRRAASQMLWFCSNRNRARKSRLYQVCEDGEGLTRVDRDDHCNDSQPNFSPDGSQVVFVSDRSGRPKLYIMPTDGSASARLLVGSCHGAASPAWSPDGRFIAYTDSVNGFSQIELLDLRTGKVRNISRDARHEGSPVWRPDGHALAYVAADPSAGGTFIGLMSPDGGDRRRLTHQPGWNTAPSFSPDGKKLVFMSNRDGNPEIYSMNLRTLSVHRLTNSPGYDTEPRFSPDGKQIVFWSDRRGTPELYVMRADGTNVQRVLQAKPPPGIRTFERDPVWVPNSDSL